jgi:hypothetical protein
LGNERCRECRDYEFVERPVAEIPIERKPRSRAGALVVLLVLILIAVGAWYWWSTQSKSPTATGLVEIGTSHAALLTPETLERG